jgi:hypothetical protein
MLCSGGSPDPDISLWHACVERWLHHVNASVKVVLQLFPTHLRHRPLLARAGEMAASDAQGVLRIAQCLNIAFLAGWALLASWFDQSDQDNVEVSVSMFSRRVEVRKTVDHEHALHTAMRFCALWFTMVQANMAWLALLSWRPGPKQRSLSNIMRVCWASGPLSIVLLVRVHASLRLGADPVSRR